MTKRMAFDVDVGVPAAVMYRDFTTIKYWEDLVVRYREEAAHTEIAHFSSDDSGTRVAFAHILTATDLPAIVRPVLPGTFVVTREQHFDPFDEVGGLATGHYRATVPHVPVDIQGDYTLTDTATGSRMRLETRCSARVPLIGGQIEGLLIGGLKGLFANEGEFTAMWIAAHH